MNKSQKNIIVLEPSNLLYEGLVASISKLENNYSFFYLDSLYETEILFIRKKISVVLINPGIVQNRINEFIKVKNQYQDVLWIGIVYSFYEQSVLNLFDDTFSITDGISEIVKKINRTNNFPQSFEKEDNQLSDRETEVLQLLAQGLSTKEIADRLYLSIHTVNTHRKNIMNKTDIRSLAGLTIYAVSKGIISLD